MTIYCNICNIGFKTKSNFKRHQETKSHQSRVNVERMFHTCDCGKKYNHRQSLSLHRAKCNAKIVQDNITELKHNFEMHYLKNEKEKEILKKQIADLLEKYENMSSNVPPPTTNNTTNNTTQNNHNINIQINAFGHENTEYITDNLYHNCICRIYDSIPCLIEQVHFNPKHPENHNVKITNKKLPHASILSENQQWKLMDKQQVIQDMMYNGYNLLDDKFKENPTQFSEVKRRQYRKFQNEFDNEQKETVKRVKTDVEMAILNGSKKIYK